MFPFAFSYLNELSQMFTAAKENEFKDEAGAVALVLDIKVLNFNRKPRYSAKRRKVMPDSSADETTLELFQQVQQSIQLSGLQGRHWADYSTEPETR